MKKTIIYKLLAVAMLLGLFSCKENKITYDGLWFVHFGQSNYNFPIAGTLKIPVFLNAPLQPDDVTATISITSDDLVEGVDYTVDKKEVTFKAGFLSDTITLTGLDTDVGKNKIISLSFESVSGNFETSNSEQSFATLNIIPNFLVVHNVINLTPADGDVWIDYNLIEGGSDASTGMWYDGTTIYAEMYGRDVSAKINSDGLPELEPVDAGTLIGPNFTGWVGDYGWSSTNWLYIPVLASDTYTALNGKTFMIAAKLYNQGGIVNYAWIKYQVSLNGDKATLVEYAYESTGKPLEAGQTE